MQAEFIATICASMNSMSTRPQSYPQADDAVLGGHYPAPVGAAVLGGVAGIRQRLSQGSIDQKIAAIDAAQQYGEAGLELIFLALQDPEIVVQKAAYVTLEKQPDTQIQKKLRHYDVYPLFECLYTLTGHTKGITAIAISTDAQIVISAGRDATIRVWDLEAREAFWIIPIPKLVYAIAISKDQRLFTVKYSDQTLTAWDLRTQQEIEPEYIPDIPIRNIASVTLSPDRQRTATHLISASQTSIKIWRLNTGRELCTLQGHTRPVTAVALATHPPLLVSGSDDRTLRVWGIA